MQDSYQMLSVETFQALGLVCTYGSAYFVVTGNVSGEEVQLLESLEIEIGGDVTANSRVDFGDQSVNIFIGGELKTPKIVSHISKGRIKISKVDPQITVELEEDSYGCLPDPKLFEEAGFTNFVNL